MRIFTSTLLILACLMLSTHIFGNPIEQRIGELKIGVNNGITNTEIFKYANSAQQGMAYASYQGQEHLFVTVRASSKKNAVKGQEARIVQFDFDSAGNVNLTPVLFTKLLPLGHGQGFGARIEHGELYFYCQSAYDPTAKTQYRGVSRVHWRGKSTGESDIEVIPLWPDDGSYAFLTPNVSTDGKHLVVLCRGRDRRFHCLVYDLSALRPYARPLLEFPVETDLAGGKSWQGLCADDKHIYFIYGGIYALQPHIIAIYDYRGQRIKEFYTENEKAVFGGQKGLLQYPHGTPWNIELEGVVLRQGALYITGICTVAFDGDIVSWKGKNYVCLQTTTGKELPDNVKFWMLTEKEATSGTFIPGNIYLSGKDRRTDKQKFVDRYKYLYKITNF